MREATVHVDAGRLCQWLLRHFAQDDALSSRICARALDLVEAVAQALQGSERRADLDGADRALTSLRALLRLAHADGRLDDRQVLHVHEQADVVGRQLGGWLRRLDGDTSTERRR